MTTRQRQTGPNWRARLWAHQVAAVDMVEAFIASKDDGAALARMPTGTGKTGVMAVLAHVLPKVRRSLIVAPWSQLTDQIGSEVSERFWLKARANPGVTLRPSAKFTPASLDEQLEPRRTELVLICTNQTLERLHATNPRGHKRLADLLDLVMVDEGHREPAPRWAEAVRSLGKPTVLFSATPYRNDRRMFNVNDRHTYRFPFPLAVQERYVRQVRFEETEWPNDAASFCKMLRGFVERRVMRQLPKGVQEPRVIVRCATDSDVQEVVSALRIQGERVVGIHETFKDGEQLSHAVPRPDATDARYWVHQFKLLEGVDDRAFCVAALYQGLGTARALVQQVGRIIRNPDRSPDQIAWVFAARRHRQRAMWDAYLLHEEALEEGEQERDPQVVFQQVLRATDQLVYADGYYRAQFDPVAEDVHTQFAYPLAAQVLRVKASFSLNECRMAVRQVLDEEDFLVCGESSPDSRTRFLAYSQIVTSPLLIDRTFPDIRLGFTVMRHIGRRLLYYNSHGIIAEYLAEHAAPEDPVVLERLLSSAVGHVSNVSLLNTDLSSYAVRRRTMTARAIENVAPGLADHIHYCSTATGAVGDSLGLHRRRYVGFSRGRVSEHTTRDVEYQEYAAWTDEIVRVLDDDSLRAPSVFERYALFIKKPQVTTPVNILFDLDDIGARQLVYHPDAPGRGQGHSISFDDACVEVGGDGAFTFVSGKLSFPAKVHFNRESSRYKIESDELQKVMLPRGPDHERRRNFLGQLNLRQAFRLITADGHAYGNGRFYRSRVPLWGRSAADKIELLQILTGTPEFAGMNSEKGTRAVGGNWDPKSLFGFIDKVGAGGLWARAGFRPDILVCDDLGNELADFIAICESPARVIMIHAKMAGGSSNLSASAFHDVCSQAVKNLDVLTPQRDRQPKNLTAWGKNYSLPGAGAVGPRLRRNPGGRTPREIWKLIETLVRHPVCEREVWIVMGSGLSLSAFEAGRKAETPGGQVIQLVYLLQATWSAVSSIGAGLRVFVRP